jgi:hypothetical protein
MRQRTGVAISMVVVLAALSISISAEAQPIVVPNSINAPPAGPGTEAPRGAPAGTRTVPGYDAAIQLGGGFTDTYGFGIGARLGYTTSMGAYIGANLIHYFGHTVDTSTGQESAHATFVGAEGGYKFFATRNWEVRPYIFAGPAFITSVDSNPFMKQSITRFAVQPGLVAAYHAGSFFVSAEGKYHVTPSPTAFTIFGGAGLGF